MKSGVLRGACAGVGRRTWPILAVLLAVAGLAGWQLTHTLRNVYAQPATHGLLLTSPQQFPTTYKGSAEALATLSSAPVALSMAAGDLDGDGYGDLAIGFAAGT